MQKIITLFRRTFDSGKQITNEVTPGAEWVIVGEGVATQKYDGTCCLVRDGKLFKRYEVKAGGNPPAHFEPACEVDPVTGKQQGWVPVGDGPEDRWHREAFQNMKEWLGHTNDGTYELCGPKIQGNPENITPGHRLLPHGYSQLFAFPRDFDSIEAAFEDDCCNMEGVVWHHPDGRMVKIKASDFGIKRKPKVPTR